jgi:hypothetical protein
LLAKYKVGRALGDKWATVIQGINKKRQRKGQEEKRNVEKRKIEIKNNRKKGDKKNRRKGKDSSA